MTDQLRTGIGNATSAHREVSGTGRATDVTAESTPRKLLIMTTVLERCVLRREGSFILKNKKIYIYPRLV